MKKILYLSILVLLAACGTPSHTASSSDEYVNIGYGGGLKKDLTTSVGSIKGDADKVYYQDIYDMIVGKCAGVEVRGEKVVIRGMGTINGSSDPLFLVNGVVSQDISYISPKDVKDITVLKDAASCAIYGSQGANGVILIQLKGAQDQ